MFIECMIPPSPRSLRNRQCLFERARSCERTLPSPRLTAKQPKTYNFHRFRRPNLAGIVAYPRAWAHTHERTKNTSGFSLSRSSFLVTIVNHLCQGWVFFFFDLSRSSRRNNPTRDNYERRWWMVACTTNTHA
jgi:hypothetical protein